MSYVGTNSFTRTVHSAPQFQWSAARPFELILDAKAKLQLSNPEVVFLLNVAAHTQLTLCGDGEHVEYQAMTSPFARASSHSIAERMGVTPRRVRMLARALIERGLVVVVERDGYSVTSLALRLVRGLPAEEEVPEVI